MHYKTRVALLWFERCYAESKFREELRLLNIYKLKLSGSR